MADESIKISQFPESTLGTGGFFVIARGGQNYKISEAILVNFINATTVSFQTVDSQLSILDTKITTNSDDIASILETLSGLSGVTDATYVKKSGSTLTGRIKCPLSPLVDEDLVNKGYVDFLFNSGNIIQSTTDVPEGDNLYFTFERVMSIFNTLTTDDIPEGITNKYLNVDIIEAIILSYMVNYLPLIGGRLSGTLEIMISGSTETYLKMQSGENNVDHMSFQNMTGVEGVFIPSILAKSDVSSWPQVNDSDHTGVEGDEKVSGNVPGYFFTLEVTENADTTVPAMGFDARNYTNTGELEYRPIFGFGSNNKWYLRFWHKLGLVIGKYNKQPKGRVHIDSMSGLPYSYIEPVALQEIPMPNTKEYDGDFYYYTNSLGQRIKLNSDNSISINQGSHGLNVGNVIRASSIGSLVKALADTEENANVIGIVSKIIDADNFVYQLPGSILETAIPAAISNSVFYLSDVTEGLITTTKPTTLGHIVKQIGTVVTNGNRLAINIGESTVLSNSGSFAPAADSWNYVNLTDRCNVIITGQNLNLLNKTGFFTGNNIINAPDTGYWYITNQEANYLHYYSYQEAVSCGDANLAINPAGTKYRRVLVNSVWGNWSQDIASSSGGGDSMTKVYPSNDDSLVSGYKKSKSINDTTETVKTITAANAKVAGEKYLFDLPIGVSSIDAGTWNLKMWSNISSNVGISTIWIRAFRYTTAGTEVDLFETESIEINNTTYDSNNISIEQPILIVDPTDYIGFEVSFKTTRVGSTTFNYKIGGINSSSLTIPLMLRHSRLRGLGWNESGHTGETGKVAGFDVNGNPIFYDINTANFITSKILTTDKTGKFALLANPVTGELERILLDNLLNLFVKQLNVYVEYDKLSLLTAELSIIADKINIRISSANTYFDIQYSFVTKGLSYSENNLYFDSTIGNVRVVIDYDLHKFDFNQTYSNPIAIESISSDYLKDRRSSGVAICHNLGFIYRLNIYVEDSYSPIISAASFWQPQITSMGIRISDISGNSSDFRINYGTTPIFDGILSFESIYFKGIKIDLKYNATGYNFYEYYPFDKLLKFKKISEFKKTILWIGTSIPQNAQYPSFSCNRLGYNLINNSLGSSGIVLTTGLGGGRAGKDLSETIAEKIARYSGHVSSSDLALFESYSYENLIIPHLNSVDAIVFDHGYNDRTQIDTEIAGLGTADFTIVDTADRTTFLGAFRYLLSKIYAVNPNIKIIIYGYLEGVSDNTLSGGIPIKTMLEAISKHYSFPIVKTYEQTGINYEFVPNSAGFLAAYNALYGTAYTSILSDGSGNITFFQYRCPDGIHPHTDKSGYTEDLLNSIAVKGLSNIII